MTCKIDNMLNKVHKLYYAPHIRWFLSNGFIKVPKILNIGICCVYGCVCIYINKIAETVFPLYACLV